MKNWYPRWITCLSVSCKVPIFSILGFSAKHLVKNAKYLHQNVNFLFPEALLIFEIHIQNIKGIVQTLVEE